MEKGDRIKVLDSEYARLYEIVGVEAEVYRVSSSGVGINYKGRSYFLFNNEVEKIN